MKFIQMLRGPIAVAGTLLLLSCGDSSQTLNGEDSSDTASQSPTFTEGGGFTGNQAVADAETELSPEDCESYAGVGCPCDTGNDCAEGYCLPTASGLACTVPCQPGDCPKDWLCQDLDKSICPGDCPPLCVPIGVYLCTPCDSNGDCKNPYSTGGLPGDLACVDYGNQGAYCGTACTGSEDCPTGYICANTSTVSGEESLRCIAQDNTCECSQLAIDEEASTLCIPEGAEEGCQGSRSCGPNGLTDCLAIAEAEVCDGLDNDCNGIVDDGSCGPDSTCECSSGTCLCLCSEGESCAAPEDGACVVNGITYPDGSDVPCSDSCGEGTQTCVQGVLGPCSVSGGLECTNYSNCGTVLICEDTCPPAPTESCNGVDDNCDGVADETFTCVQGTIETQNCTGGCGTQTRTCSDSCTWGNWSGCDAGECVPGETEEQTQACGNCGSQNRTRTCTDGCTWGNWGNWSTCSGQGTCSPGATEECGSDGCTVKTCNNSCQWGECGLASGAECAYEGGTNYQCCGSKQWQFCSPSCQWYACQGCEAGSSCNQACP